MRIRAVIFDVYGTLLQVGPEPPDADALWRALSRNILGAEPKLGRPEFFVACGQVIAKRHAAARARGIAFPEVCWPDVVAEVLPDFSPLDVCTKEDFLFRLIQSGRTARLGAGVADMLRFFAGSHCLLGIASNAQAYTIRELKEGLIEAGLNLDLFESDLCFWSYQHGFSKPDPRVFQILVARLEARGISAAETLMVGDRRDNDIEPARAHGWQTWLFGPPDTPGGGDWHELGGWLKAATST